MYRRDCMDYQLGLYLIGVGTCYVTDLRMYGKLLGRDATVSEALKRMRADGYLDEFELSGKAERKLKAVALTKKGRNDLLNVMDEDEYEYWLKYGQTAERDFHVTDESKLKRKLDNVRAMTIFVCASSPALPHDKPKLSDLYEKVAKMYYPAERVEKTAPGKTPKIAYKDLSPRECMEMLQTTGIYYTISEYREFCEEYGVAVTDTFRGSRARGIFISDKNCYVVYIAKHGDNKMIKTDRYEQSLVTSLKLLLKITSVERMMPEFAMKSASEYGGTVIKNIRNEPYAVVISDGNSLVYSMATGYPSGKIIGTPTERKMKKEKKKKRNAPKYEFLDYNNSVYRRLFVIPFTMNGVFSLDYICHNSAEDWQSDSRSIAKQFSDTFTDNSDNSYYPTKELSRGGYPAIFMPAFEVKMLYEIANQDYPVAVITYKDMLNAVAHSIMREAHYYDADAHKRFSEDSVYIYTANGDIAGVNKIEIALAKRGMKATQQELIGLPKKFGFPDPIVFFNGIARGDIDINTFIDFIDAQEYDPTPKKNIYRKSITLTTGAGFTNMIYRAARLHGKSASMYVKELIHDQVIADNDEYTKKLAENRARWKDR